MRKETREKKRVNRSGKRKIEVEREKKKRKEKQLE